MSGCCCETCHHEAFLQRAAVANGNGDVFDVLGYPAVSFQFYGTLAGGTDVAIEFETGLSTWEPLPVKNASTGVVTMTGIISTAGTYIANTVGLQKVRARVLNYAGADSINVVATAVCEGDGTAVGGAESVGGSVAVTSMPTGASATQVQGNVAHDAADSGGPVKIGGKAESTIPTAVADNDRVDAWFDLFGRQQVSAGGITTVINGSFTRPSDTDAYTAGDAVTNSTTVPAQITLAAVARVPGGSGIITGITLVDSANQATKGEFELWLFDTAVTPDNDNAAFTPTDAELATLLGVVPLETNYVGTATAGAGGNAVYPVTGLNIPFKCTGVLQDIYGLLVARNAYTPVSAEVFTFRVHVLQD